MGLAGQTSILDVLGANAGQGLNLCGPVMSRKYDVRFTERDGERPLVFACERPNSFSDILDCLAVRRLAHLVAVDERPWGPGVADP